jgi:hypothetical protein
MADTAPPPALDPAAVDATVMDVFGADPDSAPPAPDATPAPTVQPPPTPAAGTQPPPSTEGDDKPLPAFLLNVDDPAAAPPAATQQPPAEEIPVEPPESIKDEKGKANWSKLRKSYDLRGEELKTLNARLEETERRGREPNPAMQARVEQLERENRQISEVLQRTALQNHPEFVQNITAPRNQAMTEASELIKDAGGDPESFRNAMALSGKAHFDAMEEILRDLPESAKVEVGAAIREVRRLNTIEKQTLDNAQVNLTELTKRDLASQQQYLAEQQQQHKAIFTKALEHLREKDGLEVLQRTDDPKAAWWNEQGNKIQQIAEHLMFENADMGKVATACVLAASADVYRQLFRKANQRALAAEKRLKAINDASPNLRDGGSGGSDLPIDENTDVVDAIISEVKTSTGRER